MLHTCLSKVRIRVKNSVATVQTRKYLTTESTLKYQLSAIWCKGAKELFFGSTGYHTGSVVGRVVERPLQDRGDIGAKLIDSSVVHHIRLCKVWAD